MKILYTEKSGAIYMSDGYLTLAILKNRGEATPSGINHFGFQVDDIKDIEARLAKFDEPLAARPIGVRAVETITASGMPPILPQRRGPACCRPCR